MGEKMLLAHLKNMPPEQAILQLSTSHWLSQAVAVVTRFGIPDLLKDGSKSAEELAHATGTQPESLYRLLRLLAGFGIFAEQEARHFALTDFSEKLRSDVPGSMRNWVVFNGEPWRLNMLSNLGDLIQNGQTIYQYLYQSSIFDYFTANPEIGDAFNRAMQAWSLQAHTSAVEAYDFSHMRLVVDVGGGHGNLLMMILRAYPALRGILFETPGVADMARQAIQSAATRYTRIVGADDSSVSLPVNMMDKCDIIAGNFFESLPANGDAYILSTILNDWTDDQCVTILNNCRQAMHPTAKLLILETTIGPPNEPEFGKIMDIAMLLETTGRVRTEKEFQQLIASAGLQWTRTIPTRASSVHIIEAVRADV